MKWTTLNFSKYAGLSLPQIILADADWFFLGIQSRGVLGQAWRRGCRSGGQSQGDQNSPNQTLRTGKLSIASKTMVAS
jgi:hypothetical protein